MPTIKVEKKSNYTVLDNGFLRDQRLSLRAVGLLARILSLPPQWDYSIAGLAAIVRDGSDSVRSGLKELENAGYLIRSRVRRVDGTLGPAQYTIYEVPPTQAEPMWEKPIQEKQPQLSKDQLNKDKVSKYKNIIYMAEQAEAAEKDPLEDTALGRVVELYSNSIHPVSGGIELDRLAELLDTFGENAVVEAIAKSKFTNISYVEAVVKNRQRRDDTNGRTSSRRHNNDRYDSQNAASAEQEKWKKVTGWND